MAGALQGAVALVTGSGRGIGKAIAELFATEGARVVVNDIGTSPEGQTSDPGVADAVVQGINAAGGTAVANHDSVATMTGARNMVATAVDAFGHLDILVNNAGIFRPVDFLDLRESDWDDVLAVHLKGAFVCAQSAAREMAHRGYGRIINISSKSALGVGSSGGSSKRSPYAAAKAGILGLTRVLSRELAPLGITCNAVMPFAKGRMEGFGKLSADRGKGPPGQTEDVAPTVAYLASRAGGMVTGRTFWVSGGRIELYSDPAPRFALMKSGRWTIEELEREIPAALGSLD
jgi:NAD(P)-dependent dehydrogenase (short-subunit alcohol dehydrogenase family)